MRISRATAALARNLLASVSAAALVAAPMGDASAHTVSIGYAFSGPGAVTLWYGSYHNTAIFNEADTQLVGPSYNTTRTMNLITSIKPMGLVDGTNNFYSNTAGTALVATPQSVVSTDGSGGSFDPATKSVLNWQGVVFSGLRPGTYTFTYNPLALPTVEWHPINDVIRTNSFTLTAQDVLGITGYRFYGTNDNQRSVGRALDTAISAGAFNQRIYDIAALPAPQMANALTQLSGEVHTQSSRAAFQPTGIFLTTMLDPFAAGGLRGGGFGAAPGATFYGSPSVGGGYGGSYGGYGGSPYGSPNGTAYDPQSPYGAYGPGANRSYGGSGYGDPNNPNGAYGNSGYGNASSGNNGGAYRGGGLLQRSEFENRWSLWQTTYGGYSTAAGNAATGSHDTKSVAGGVIAGLDFQFDSGGVLGAAIAAGIGSWSLADDLGSGKNDVFQFGLYGSQRFGDAYISAAASYGWHQMKTDRTVRISGSDNLRGSFDAETLGGRVETGYRFALNDYGFTPHVAGQVMAFKSPDYTEVAAGNSDFALAVAGRTTTQSRTEAGAWLDHSLPFDGDILTLRGRLAWVHEWSDAPSVNASLPSLAGSGFTVVGATPAADRLLVSAASELHFAYGLSLGTKFDGEFAPGAQNYLGSATIRYRW